MPTTDATQLSEIDRADSVVVAFSGGADSLALLVLLSRFLPSGQLVAVYVNHRLRSEEELAAEERLNETNCRTLGIPLRIVRLGRDQVSKLAAERDKGIEEAARTLRYEALQRVREELGFSLIATAHTADDQAETMLMRMLQGSSAAGLRGIARRNGHVVRPILSFTRAGVLAWCESGLDCSEDSSNAQLHFLRNRIRSQVVPSIAQVFPGYREALDELARHSRQVMEVLEPLARGVFDGAVRMTDGGAVIELPKLCAHPDALVELVLYRVWDLLRGDERVGRGMIARLLGAVRKREATRIVANGTSVSIEDGVMTWKTGGAALAGGFVSLVYSERTVLDS